MSGDYFLTVAEMFARFLVLGNHWMNVREMSVESPRRKLSKGMSCLSMLVPIFIKCYWNNNIVFIVVLEGLQLKLDLLKGLTVFFMNRVHYLLFRSKKKVLSCTKA